MNTKLCKRCKTEKDTSEFSPYKYSKDKLNYWCKSCRSEYQRNQNRKNGSPAKKLRDPSHLKQNLKECFECNQLLSLDNFSPSTRGYGGVSAYCKACQNKRAKKNRKEQSEYVRSWRKGNEKWLIQHRNHQQKRRATIQENTVEVVTTEFMAKLYNQEICYYCNQAIPKTERTADHKIPISRGGSHSKENLVMACRKCNSSKKDKTDKEFKNDKD